MSRRVALVGVSAGTAIAGYVAYTKTRRGELYAMVKPALDQLDAERVHRLGIEIGSRPWLVQALGFADTVPDAPSLRTTVWGVEFSNPIGLAAGYDKNGESIAGLATMGFGFVEVGSVTPQPQPGNPKPRVFRLPEDKAVINRYGFNSDGMALVAARTSAWHRAREAGALPARSTCVLGINLGKNKETVDAAADYEAAMETLGVAADYIVVNVSSPNTPGLRALQGRHELDAFLRRMMAARDRLPSSVDPLRKSPVGEPGAPLSGRRPLLLKIAPDLTDAELQDIAAIVLTLRIDGVIVSNTMTERPPTLRGEARAEAGGLSGQPLFDKSTAVLARMYELTKGKVPLVGVGGVSDARQAYAKVRAGASLVQVYTGFAYEGPALVPKLKQGMAELLAADGFKSVAEAVGADHRRARA